MFERPPDGERLTEEWTTHVVYLVPVGCRPLRAVLGAAGRRRVRARRPARGFWRRLAHRGHLRWREAVRSARHAEPDAGFLQPRPGRGGLPHGGRDRRAAHAVDPARGSTAELVHPSDRRPEEAAAIRDRILTGARTYHVRWLFVRRRRARRVWGLHDPPGPERDRATTSPSASSAITSRGAVLARRCRSTRWDLRT